jgi:hypothetical protein
LKHGLATEAVTMGVMLMSIMGCQGQAGVERTASAQARSGSSPHAVSASWSKTRTVEVKDPALNATAFTLDVPIGWKFIGTILRPHGCHAPSTPADGLTATALSPDGVSGYGQLPGVSWSWASDGISPLGPKCKTTNINSAAGFLLNIAVPMIEPNAKIIGIVPLTEKMQQGLAAQNQQMGGRYGANSRVYVDTARIRIEFDLNGHPMEELLGVILTCQESNFPAYPQMHRAARTTRSCSTHGTYFKHAPKGHLDELIASNPTGARIDQGWDQEISQRMRENFARYQKASDEQFKAIQQHFTDQTNQMVQHGREVQAQLKESTEHAMDADRARQGAIDHAAHLQVLDSLNRQDFIDPTTGRKIETSNQFTHNWISSDKDSVVLGDDATFDPNGVVDPGRESWIELIPAN